MLLLLVLLYQLKVIGWLVLVDIEVQVLFEHKVRTRLRRLQIVDQTIELCNQIEPIYHSALLCS